MVFAPRAIPTTARPPPKDRRMSFLTDLRIFPGSLATNSTRPLRVHVRLDPSATCSSQSEAQCQTDTAWSLSSKKVVLLQWPATSRANTHTASICAPQPPGSTAPASPAHRAAPSHNARWKLRSWKRCQSGARRRKNRRTSGQIRHLNGGNGARRRNPGKPARPRERAG